MRPEPVEKSATDGPALRPAGGGGRREMAGMGQSERPPAHGLGIGRGEGGKEILLNEAKLFKVRA